MRAARGRCLLGAAIAAARAPRAQRASDDLVALDQRATGRDAADCAGRQRAGGEPAGAFGRCCAQVDARTIRAELGAALRATSAIWPSTAATIIVAGRRNPGEALRFGSSSTIAASLLDRALRRHRRLAQRLDLAHQHRQAADRQGSRRLAPAPARRCFDHVNEARGRGRASAAPARSAAARAARLGRRARRRRRSRTAATWRRATTSTMPIRDRCDRSSQRAHRRRLPVAPSSARTSPPAQRLGAAGGRRLAGEPGPLREHHVARVRRHGRRVCDRSAQRRSRRSTGPRRSVRAAREAGAPQRVRRTRRNSSRISSAAPTVIALSATLNDGK